MKQFTFSSELQRMSVLVRRLPLGEDPELGTSPHRTDVFVKGAPETIQQLCVKGSVPDDFSAVLQGFTLQGYRVLALAHKVMDLPWHRMDHTDRSLGSRGHHPRPSCTKCCDNAPLPAPPRSCRSLVEDGLSLLGLLVLQNALKPETAPVIRELWQAALRTVMVTGWRLVPPRRDEQRQHVCVCVFMCLSVCLCVCRGQHADCCVCGS